MIFYDHTWKEQMAQMRCACTDTLKVDDNNSDSGCEVNSNPIMGNSLLLENEHKKQNKTEVLPFAAAAACSNQIQQC